MAFCGYLKQSTAATVMLGPFVDETDGKTAETGLTVSQADVRLSKNGGDMAQKDNADACTHDEIGIYSCALSTTDTNTLGLLDVMVHESGALPVHQTYQVVTANWWDTMCSTDQLDVNVTNVAGTAQTANDNGADINAILVDTAEIGAAGAGLTAIPWNAAWDAEVESEVDDALGGGTGTALTAIPWNAAWDAEVQSECTDALNAYDPPTKAELDTAVADVSVDEIQASALADLFNTDSGTNYAGAVAGSVVKETADNAGGSALTEAGIADAVWDEAQADHVGAGTFGEVATESASILADTNELQGDLTDGGRLDLLIDAIKAKTDNLPADPADDSDIDTQLAAIAGYLDTEVAAILADTNELQGDLADGGRLDLLVDAIKAKTDNLPADPADDSDIDTQLAAIAGYIDTEIATIDGIVDAIKAVTDKLDDTLEDDSGTYRFTANALEEAPTAAGAGGTAFTYTLTSTVDGAPIADADVWVTSDAGGTTVLASGKTDSSGEVTFYLDTGTVYVWRQKSGWNFTNPDTETVA